MAKNYIDLLQKLAVQKNEPKYQELADYLNHRLIVSGLSIFDFVPVDGIRWDHSDLLPYLWDLKAQGFFDGN